MKFEDRTKCAHKLTLEILYQLLYKLSDGISKLVLSSGRYTEGEAQKSTCRFLARVGGGENCLNLYSCFDDK
jgi:hypothetical protein